MNTRAPVYATFAIAAVMGFAMHAGAQEATPSPTPTPTETAAPADRAWAAATAPTKFWLEVDQNDLAAISQALNELPKRMADPLILKLNSQLQAQQQIVANKAEAEKVKKAKK